MLCFKEDKGVQYESQNTDWRGSSGVFEEEGENWLSILLNQSKALEEFAKERNQN